jgi:hypothetical protein
VSEPKTMIEMFGEYLREAAVLSGVFIPLDRVLGQKANLIWGYIWVTLSMSIILLATGIIAERYKDRTT